MTALTSADTADVNTSDSKSSEASNPCLLCRSADTYWFRRGVAHHHYPIEGRFDTRHCRGCGVEWVSLMPGADQIGNFYPPAYYAHEIDTRPTAWQRLVRLVGLRVRSKEPSFKKVDICAKLLDLLGRGDCMVITAQRPEKRHA